MAPTRCRRSTCISRWRASWPRWADARTVGRDCMNIAELVRYWARWRPGHTAVITDDVRTSWAEFDARSDAIARGLRAAGVSKGDRVGMHLDNRIEAPLLTIACLKLGAILVPLNFKLTGGEILPLLEDADCKIVVSQARYLPQLELAA